MEMPELDNKIKRALLSKAQEIEPSEEAFALILAGLEKKQARGTFKTNCKHCVIALICMLSVLAGIIFILLADVKASALEFVNTAKTAIVLTETNQVLAKNADGVLNHTAVSDDIRLTNWDTSKTAGISVMLLQTFAGCFLFNQVNLEFYLRLLIIEKMTLAQTWYNNKFWHRQVPLY